MSERDLIIISLAAYSYRHMIYLVDSLCLSLSLLSFWHWVKALKLCLELRVRDEAFNKKYVQAFWVVLTSHASLIYVVWYFFSFYFLIDCKWRRKDIFFVPVVLCYKNGIFEGQNDGRENLGYKETSAIFIINLLFWFHSNICKLRKC